MSTHKLSNISLENFREFLTNAGCKKIRTKGGHEIWARKDLNRPIIIQSHVDPVPEFIIKNNIRLLNISKEQFFKILFDC